MNFTYGVLDYLDSNYANIKTFAGLILCNENPTKALTTENDAAGAA
jgi:hypothetical protein